MSDYLQLGLVLAIILFVYLALRRMGTPRKISENEYAESLRKSGSTLSVGVEALSKVLNPAQGKGKVEAERSVRTENVVPVRTRNRT